MSETTTRARRPAAGDVIEVDSPAVGDGRRLGEILEVLGTPERPHYRVRWIDGHESVFYPADGVSVHPPRARR